MFVAVGGDVAGGGPLRLLETIDFRHLLPFILNLHIFFQSFSLLFSSFWGLLPHMHGDMEEE